MVFLIFSGIVSLLFGIMILLFPQTLRNLDIMTSKAILDLDEKIFRLRIGVGISSIIASILVFFVVYWLIQTSG